MARKRGRSIEDRVRDQVKKRNDSGGTFRPILNFDGVDPKPTAFKIEKAGKIKISILPYIVATDNHPDLDIGDEDYKLEVYVHQGVGPNNDMVLCKNRTYGKSCYICEERQKLIDTGLEWDNEEVRALGSSRRCWYNIEVPGQEEKKIQIWHKVSWTNFEKRLMGTSEEDYEDVVIFASLKDGAYVNFKAVDAKFGTTKYFDYENFSLESRPKLTDSKLDEAYALDKLLIVPTYEEVKALFLGGEVPEEKEPTPEPTPKPKPGKEPVKRRSKAPESEELESSKCPFDHTFGLDCNNHDSCAECEEDMFTECIDLQEAMKEPEEPKKRVLKRK